MFIKTIECDTNSFSEAITKDFSKIEDIPDFDGYNIILFIYPNETDYYRKPYISICLESWCWRLKKVRYIYVLIDEEVMGLSKWSQHCNGNKKFITDSLRIYFVNKFDNCFYLDTDVYFSHNINLADVINKHDNFVVKCCTGTCLYNKHKNSEILNDFFLFYETELFDKPFVENSDIIAYDHFIEYRRNKGLEPLLSLDINEMIHFSILYPWERDHEHITICLAPWLVETTAPKDNVIVFPTDAFWPCMMYLYDHRLRPDLVYGIKDDDKIITFKN